MGSSQTKYKLVLMKIFNNCVDTCHVCDESVMCYVSLSNCTHNSPLSLSSSVCSGWYLKLRVYLQVNGPMCFVFYVFWLVVPYPLLNVASFVTLILKKKIFSFCNYNIIISFSYFKLFYVSHTLLTFTIIAFFSLIVAIDVAIVVCMYIHKYILQAAQFI